MPAAPLGLRTDRESRPAPPSAGRPYSCGPSDAASRSPGAALDASRPASPPTLPFSLEIAWISSGVRASNTPAISSSTRVRNSRLVFQSVSRKARRAAATASFASPAPPTAYVPIFSPVAGSKLSWCCAESRHLPSIQCLATGVCGSVVISSSLLPGEGRDGLGAVGNLAVQPTVLVEVAEHLDAERGVDPAGLHGVEPGGSNQALDRGHRLPVVRRVVERGARRGTVRAGGERFGAQRPERLDVVRAFRQPLRNLGPSRDAVRKRSHELPAVAGLDRVRRVDDHLVLKQAGVLADQLLDRVEPHRAPSRIPRSRSCASCSATGRHRWPTRRARSSPGISRKSRS